MDFETSENGNGVEKARLNICIVGKVIIKLLAFMAVDGVLIPRKITRSRLYRENAQSCQIEMNFSIDHTINNVGRLG